ncbi:ATP-binding protein [Mitsuaria sp. GD03876]|uniref:sensor histidine kinase n=1 Tax=Mitsuaria sp. GD03876 TaxID=2975399 RepID=UPI00244CEFDD|nr:ATP-binding protein [Mitsuaria sp. GD03876]MDH0866684.1 ATP-binding protein [Mitsuaria sp. GD03876]
MTAWLRGLWPLLASPSLARRLVTAQMGLLVALWTLLFALVLYEGRSRNELIDAQPIADAFISVTQNFGDQPERLHESLVAMDMAVRGVGSGGEPENDLSPRILVWRGADLVYRSSPETPLLTNTKPDVLERISDADGKEWLVRTRVSPSSGIRVVMMVPGVFQMVLTVYDRGYYLLPLLVSLPFLVLPAWLSVRMALRPWREVGDELSARGPSDLAPLRFQARHLELRPLAQAINALLQRVRDSAERERSLIADAAHELRTPLAAMRVNVEAMKDEATDPRERALMGSLLRSNERATRLVGQLLRLMRSDAEKSQDAFAMLDLEELIQDRLALMEALADVRGVALELISQGPQPVFGERESLVSMIDNLVDNAIKYSPQGGEVVVRLSRMAGRAVLSIDDQGPGIAPELRARVFDRFFRSPDQTQSGSGLGLAIVKSVVERHRGQVHLTTPDANPGLRVVVHLPLHGGS